MRPVLFVVAALFAFGYGARLPTPRLDGRIVGGTQADIKDFPYQLALLSYGYQICGASIISENWVLTAAHCVYRSSASEFSVRAGSSNQGSGGSIHNAEEVIWHPQYDSYATDYDYALIRVKEPFPLGNPGVQAVSLADVEPAAGDSAVVTGWGNTGSGYPDLLQKVSVPIVDRKECQEKYDGYDITDRMICAGYTDGGKDACQGDSGGPLVVDGKLSGIVSWGIGCALPNYPGVYTNVAGGRSWIKENTGI